jgi:hypothetical protein
VVDNRRILLAVAGNRLHDGEDNRILLGEGDSHLHDVGDSQNFLDVVGIHPLCEVAQYIDFRFFVVENKNCHDQKNDQFLVGIVLGQQVLLAPETVLILEKEEMV